MTDNRLGIWLSFVRFLLGTIAIGIVSIAINAKFQEREITLKEQEHLAKFVDTALTKDLGPRLLMAGYFAKVTQSSGLKEGWKAYLATLEDDFKKKSDAVAKRRQRLAQLEIAVDRSPEGPTKLSDLVEMRTTREELLALEGELDPHGRIVPTVALDMVTNTSARLRQMVAFCAGGLELKVELDEEGVPTSTKWGGKAVKWKPGNDENLKLYQQYVDCLTKRIDVSEIRNLGIAALN
jgi:hypothetical protein